LSRNTLETQETREPQKTKVMKSKARKGKTVSGPGYTEAHAASGVHATLPEIETWPNQYKGYEIAIEIPEYTAICPKTGLPDFGTIRIRYMPDKACLELKSLKLYIHAYRNLGIFYENAVNRILQDVVTACRPVWARVTGEFTARGGLRSAIEAKYP
jgi:7-cyano-7-deazaguanine reductase